MTQSIITNIAELLIISPIALITLKKLKINWLQVLFFTVFFIFHEALLHIPNQFPQLKLFNGLWNWTGKIYALVGSIIFYFFFKKYFKENDFLTFKQKKNSLRYTLTATIILILLTSIISFFISGKSDPNNERFWFQFTMPGFDEEIAFRGIMLGLLSTSLKEKFIIRLKNFGNPSILITSVLFGLVHSLKLGEDWQFHQNWIYFSYTFAFALVLGWMTIKSRSILMPVIAHNLSNTIGTIVTWI